MSINAFNYWLSTTTVSRAIQTTSGAIAGIQVVHILCIATLFAVALNLALRFAGRGLAAEPLASLAGRFIPVMWICLTLLLVTGLLLIIAEPFRTLNNSVFYLKMTLILVAVALTLVFRSIAQRRPEQASPHRAVVAVLYMLVWTAVIVAGRFIAYH